MMWYSTTLECLQETRSMEDQACIPHVREEDIQQKVLQGYREAGIDRIMLPRAGDRAHGAVLLIMARFLTHFAYRALALLGCALRCQRFAIGWSWIYTY
jgi:hypothetical protein